jgi:hypothetical protein
MSATGGSTTDVSTTTRGGAWASIPAWFALLAVALVLVVTDVVVVPTILREETRDWHAYEQAAERLDSGKPLYVWELADESQEYYLYPPPTAAVWSLGLNEQSLIVLKLIALLGVGALAAFAGARTTIAVVGGGLALVGLALLSPPVIHDLVLANVMVFYLGAVALSIARPGWLGAVPLGVLCAIALKPTIGPYLLWLFLRRRGDFAKTFVAGVATTLLFAVVLGPGRYVEYVQALPRMLTLATPFTGNVGLVTISREVALVGVFLAYAGTLVAARWLSPAASVAVALAATLLAQPTIGFNYLGMLIPALVAIWTVDRRVALAGAVVVPLVAIGSAIGAAVLVASLAIVADWVVRRAASAVRRPERSPEVAPAAR